MVALLGLAAALFVAAPALAEPLSAGMSLAARQLPFDPSTLPSSCNACTDLTTRLTDTACVTDFTCLCGKPVVDAITACYTCVIDLDTPGVTDDDLQQAANAYVDACRNAGQTVDVNIGGGSGSNTNTNSATGTNTGTGASPTATSPSGSNNSPTTTGSNSNPTSTGAGYPGMTVSFAGSLAAAALGFLAL